MGRNAVLFTLCIICTLLCVQCKHAEPGIIELPLTLHNGAGPFDFANGSDHIWLKSVYERNDSEYSAAFPEIKGLPEGWDEGQRAVVIMDNEQYVFQNYVAGKLPEDHLIDILEGGADTTMLSRESVKCYVNIARKEVEGGKMVLIDMDNDLDFGNEEAFFVKDEPSESRVPVTDRPTVTPRFESWREGHIVVDSITLAIGEFSAVGLTLSYLRYATAELNGVELVVLSNEKGNFTTPFFDSPAVIPDINGRGSINQKHYDRIAMGYSFKQKGAYYKVLGVDPHRNVLRLEVLDGSPETVGKGTSVIALMEGTDALDFLKPYEGKYVFLDFWGTWCGPCMAEIPTLKEVYSKIDKDKVEFIGIVCREFYDEKTVAKHGITWPQVNDPEENMIVPLFQVKLFPTTFLIDPSGVIVARNLRGKAVERKLQRLGLLK